MSDSGRRRNNRIHTMHNQQGAAFIVMLVILVLGASSILVSSLGSASIQIERDAKTAEALSQAREALIGFATSVNLTSGSARLGDLPCPDNHSPGTALEGTPSAPCSGNAIGRLPWKTLGLPDLRDGSGERLWYAVSVKFKNSPRTTCTSSGQAGCLNSDTEGTLTVLNSDGTVIHAGNTSTGAVAVIIAPGAPLQRQGSSSLQDRSIAGTNTASNYLDIATIGSVTEDNANFVDSSATNGFVHGRVLDSNGEIIVNDQLLVITEYHIIPQLEKRVVAEVKNCLVDYALNNTSGLGRYPWAAPITDLGTTYNDSTNTFFGRIPDDLSNTNTSSSDNMDNQWGSACNTHTGSTSDSWWINWKEHVFYGVSRKFRPRDSIPSATISNFLTVNPSGSLAKFVVIIAGEKLSTPNQANRNTNKTNAFYYLEGGNENATQDGLFTFTQGTASTTFNDTLIYQ